MNSLKVLWRAFYEESFKLIKQYQFSGFFKEKKSSDKIIQVNLLEDTKLESTTLCNSTRKSNNITVNYQNDNRNISNFSIRENFYKKAFAKGVGTNTTGIECSSNSKVMDDKTLRSSSNKSKNKYKRTLLFDNTDENLDILNLF